MAVLAVLHLVLRGIQPLLPGLVGFLRGLLHPLVLALVAVVVLLFRATRSRRKSRADGAAHPDSE